MKASILAYAALLSSFPTVVTLAQTSVNDDVTLFQNVRIFDGKAGSLSGPRNVLVRGNKIEIISAALIPTDHSARTQVIDGSGRTLMPGLIDAHTHLMFASVPEVTILTADIGFVQIAAGKAATEMLMRGFTSVRDLGGPVFGLKRAIDSGLIPGPRIWPSGAFISQTGGHGDFRLPNELPSPPGYFSYSERIGGAAIADDPAMVRLRAREQLALGASQIKMMAGGGISSHYDPLDVTQYTVEELHAGVEAAANWGTYVTVHAYTPRAVRQAIEAGVKCVDHGQLLDEPTVKLMAEKDIWWSLQPFIGESTYPEGSPNRAKQMEMFKGTDTAYQLAKKYHMKIAWGSDILFSAESLAQQTKELTKLLRWYTAAEILKMATADNADLLALSGERSPYGGKLGVIEEGALADLLLIDGDPIANIKVLEDSNRNILFIMKDGKIYKNTISK